jgi:hypothetical protein
MTLPVTDFIVQRLLEFDPTFDVGSGVATTGLLIEPLSVVLQPIVDELTVVQATQSVLTILEAANPDSFAEDIVDAIASNVFVERDPGNIGSTVQRLRFFAPQAFSAPQGALVWLGASGQRYENSAPVSISNADMSLNQDGTLYYVDIPIVALEEGDTFNVDAGAIQAMEAQPIGVANTTNLYKITDGRNRETNTELIDRIKVAVTVRALVTGRGIIVTLTENFTSIVEILPIGFGAPEMMRDIVYNVHIGGDVDVWVKTASVSSGQKDILGLQVDTSRRRAIASTVALIRQGVLYDLGRSSIDRTDGPPTVTTIDGAVTYKEGVDYFLDDVNGTIARPPGSSIFHIEEDGALGQMLAGQKQLTHTTNATFFQNVRAGMILTVLGPAPVMGRYTIKRLLNAATVEIYGGFPAVSSGVSFQIDDLLSVAYEYNPVTVDLLQAPRSPGLANYTITDVPILQVSAVQKLDPLTLQPTGALYNNRGGFGAGAFGAGAFGVGTAADYQLRVPDPTLRFSIRESNYIEFQQSFAGQSARVLYDYDASVPVLQAFCDDPENQTEAASLLVRRFVPVYVDGLEPVVYTIPAASQATALSETDMLAKIVAFINGLSEGQALEASDVVDLLYNNGADEVDIDPLLKLRGAIQHQDGAVEFISPDARGILTIPSLPIPDPSSRPLSERIARFLARNLTVTRLVV